MNGLLAFKTGLARTLRYWPIIAVLLAVNLLSAALLALLPASGLLGASYRTPFRTAADGVDPWLVLETLLSSQVDSALDEPDPGAGLRQIILTGLIVILAAVPVAWLPAAFLSGGVLLTYAESPEPIGWRRFLWASWRWFGAFLLLGLVQGIVILVIGAPLIVLAARLLSGSLQWLGWLVCVLLVGLAFWGLALVEYAGAFMVVRQSRNIFDGLGLAFRYLLRNPARWAALYALAILLLVAINIVYYFGLEPFLPLAWWPALLGARQLFVAARLWARLVRWAGVMATIEP